MDPFSAWLVGSVVLPDAYERVVNSLSTKSAEDRLATRVREDVGRYPERAFREWYHHEATWRELVNGGRESFDSLVDRLIAYSGARLFGRALSREAAETIVRAAVRGFLGSLDAADAVDVADFRSAQRDAQIDRNAADRTSALRDHLDSRFDAVASLLDVAGDFDDRVSGLPALVRPLFVGLGASTEASRLLDISSTMVPREGLVQLTADIPPWLRDADAATLIAAAELCRCYEVHLGAGRLFELAADRSAERAYCYARAAVEFEAVGETGRSRELINQATSLSTSNSVLAIAAALANEPDRVLELIAEPDAFADLYLVLLRLFGLTATRQSDDVIGFLDAALDRYPESSGLMIHLAWAHLRRSQEATTTSRTADRQRALDLALEARRLRRDWRADAGDAAHVACQAALLLGAYQQVIEIGMTPPEGVALPAEAANTEVRLSVAQAAIAAGRTDLLGTVVDLVPDGFHRAIIQAEFLLNTGADATELQHAYNEVWVAATEEEHRVLYWLSGAAAGIRLQGEAELRARADDVPLLVDAQLRMATGDHDGAIQLLRRSHRTEQTSRLLVQALIATDDVDAAVEELKVAATRFNDTSHLVRAVEVLGRRGRLDDAAVLAKEALQRVPRTLTETRTFLHEVLVEQAGMSAAWGEMAVRCRAWIEDLGPSARNRWQLVLSLHNGGDQDGAWRIAQEIPPLKPDSALTAQLWVILAAHEAPSPETANQVIALVDEYPDDTELAEAAVRAFFGRGDDVWGDVQPDTIRRFQELLSANAVDFGSDEAAAMYVLPGTSEEMLERLRPSLEANSRVIEEMSEKVREGLPYGLLAAAANRPYTAALIQRGAGCLPIATIDAERDRVELAAAKAAIGQAVVIDVSTLVVAGHIRAAWPDLRGAFAQLELPSPGRRDILEAAEGFRLPVHGTLYFDRTVQAVRASDADPQVQARLRDHADWVVGELGDLNVVDWPRLTAITAEHDERFLPWLSALDMAKSRDLPLWCDDVGVRTLAINDNVATFGTAALVAALVEASAVDAGTAQTVLRGLREAYAVDLPLDADWLRLSAASDEWRAGPSALYFTRSAGWLDFELAYGLWSEMAQAAAEIEPMRVVGWLHAAALGLAAGVDALSAPRVLAAIAAKAIVLAGFNPEAIAACTARVREVAAAAGVQSPVPHLMSILLDQLKVAIGAEGAARVIMSEYLAEEDRLVLRDLVFGISSGPDQPQP
jgi:hypothetical protein